MILSLQKDIFTLETDSIRYTIQAPGHTFEDGDEVDFEFFNGTVYLSKKTTSVEGLAVNAFPEDQLILQADPGVDVLTRTLKSIVSVLDSGENPVTVSMDLLRQLSMRIRGQISENQQIQLDEIIGTIGRKNSADIPDLVKRINALVDVLGMDALHVPSSLGSVTRLVTFPELMIDEGIYQFHDLSSVKEFLGNPEMDGWEKKLNELFGRDGVVWMRIVDTGDKYPGAFQVAPAALRNEMVTMISLVSREILKQFPIETFLDYSNVHGGIDKKLIELLRNQQVCAMDNFMTSAPGGTSSDTCLQWLQTLSEYRGCAEILVSRQPSRSTDLFRGLLELQETYDVLPGVCLNEIGIVPGSGKNAISLIENTLQKIGFLTERKLSEGVLSCGSVKTELLHLLNSSQNGEHNITAVNALADKHGGSDSFDILQSFRLFKSLLRQECSHLKNGTFSQNEVYLNMLSQTEDVIDHFLRSSDESSVAQMLSRISAEMRERLSVLVNSVETIVQPKVSAEIAFFQKMDGISSVLSFLKQICGTLPVFNSQYGKLDTIITELKTYLNDVQGENEADDLPNTSETSDLQKRCASEGLADKQLQRDSTIVESGKNVPQKIVEQLVNRIESLQILARQVATSEGTSQILELPVKIGNEWTDVTLHIVKKEPRKKGSSKALQHFSVYLDTTPSRLGKIHTVLDYEKGKNLSITMEFEHKEVAFWFIRNQEFVRKSLQENQIHFVSLNFKTAEVHDNGKLSENLSDQSRKFDIRA